MKYLLLIFFTPLIMFSQEDTNFNVWHVNILNRYEYSPYFYQSFEINDDYFILTTTSISRFDLYKVQKVKFKDIKFVKINIGDNEDSTSVIEVIFGFQEGSALKRFYGSASQSLPNEFVKTKEVEFDFTLRMSFLSVVNFDKWSVGKKIIELIEYNGGNAILK